MAAIHLDERRVGALKPRKSARDVRDRELKGFGVRILPSGRKRYFVHTQHEGRRIWRIIGDVASISAEEARVRAKTLLAEIRQDGDPATPAPTDTPFETVAEEVFRRYGRNWKPSTRTVNRIYYTNHILPWFGGRPIGRICERDVRQWFASLHNKPFAADRSAPILSVILKQAALYGYRPDGSNPCKGIRRYRRKGRERFLSEAEIGRLGAALRHHESRSPSAVAIIRLLLLTGCRKGEIVSLKWSFYREGNLFLRDSKTGPRTVWLSCDARTLLDHLPRTSAWVFPSSQTGHCVSFRSLDREWHCIRAEAGLPDVRLHDLRHTYASVALAQGETVLVISRLLGHGDPATTLKYTHLADSQLREAVETIGATLGG